MITLAGKKKKYHNNEGLGGYRYSSVIECHKALGSIPSTHEKK